MIGRLVEAWCLETGTGITPYGSWTLESKESERGVEPDEGYVLGDEIEPAQPDLAIEVIWTSRGLSQLDVYRKLDVREVWLWRRGQLEVYALRAEQYEAIPASEVLCGIDLPLLLQFVAVRPMTRAVSEFREALHKGWTKLAKILEQSGARSSRAQRRSARISSGRGLIDCTFPHRWGPTHPAIRTRFWLLPPNSGGGLGWGRGQSVRDGRHY